MKLALSFLALLLLASSASAVPPPPRPTPIQFAPGKASGKVSGAVLRGERDFYSLDAKAGQKMTVAISALEDNAVFQIYAPGAEVARDSEGDVDVTGKALSGADGDTKRWTGRLPAGGSYLIEVGGTRGNATYELTISIE